MCEYVCVCIMHLCGRGACVHEHDCVRVGVARTCRTGACAWQCVCAKVRGACVCEQLMRMCWSLSRVWVWAWRVSMGRACRTDVSVYDI